MSIQLHKLDCVIVYLSEKQTSGIILAVLHDPDVQGITLQQR